MSAHPNYPPFHWRSGNTLTGASIELSEHIFSELGVKAHVVYMGPWKRVLKSAKDDKIDFIPALKKTSERRAYLEFTEESFAANPVAVFTRKGEIAQLNGLWQLSNSHGSINAGDRHGEQIDTFLKQQHNIQQIHGITQNFQMLKMKRVDYVLTGLLSAQSYLKSNALENQFDVVLKLNNYDVHNAFTLHFSKKCPEVVKQFNLRLRELKQQNKITPVLQDYQQVWLSL
ncbi:substrate-binding periplasmic protein [Pseudoalteromonas phenolica]|nr:transporter substrate-binding domain-containing protein [Pseudoalteromonas phenolica]